MRRCRDTLRRLGLAILVALSVMAGAVAHGRAATVVAVSRTAKELVSPQALAVDERTGHVFAITNSFSRNSTGTVSMLSAASGRLLHTASVGTYPTALAVDERTGRAFVLSGLPSFGNGDGTRSAAGHVSVLDTTSGHLLRTVAVGLRPLMLAVDSAAQRVFVVTDGETGNGYAATLKVLDAATGRLLRTVMLDNNPTALGVDEPDGHVFVAGDYRTSMFDARSGALLHSTVVGNHPQAVLVHGQSGRVFIVSPDGAIDVLDGRTGAARRPAWGVPAWVRPMVGGSAIQSMAIDEHSDHLFAASAGDSSESATATVGHVHVLDGVSGTTLGTVAVGEYPLAVAVAPSTGRVFVLNSNEGNEGQSAGSVSVLDAAGGRVLRTIALAATPAALVVAEHSGHVFVLDDTMPGGVTMLDARTGAVLSPRRRSKSSWARLIRTAG